MRRITKYHKRIKTTYALTSCVIAFILVFALNSVEGYTSEHGIYNVLLGNAVVGTVNAPETAEQAYLSARRRLAATSDSLIFLNGNLSVEKLDRLNARVSDYEELEEHIFQTMAANVDTDYTQAYILSTGQCSVVLESMEAADELLQILAENSGAGEDFNVSLSTEKKGNFEGISCEITLNGTVTEKVSRVMAAGANGTMGESEALESVGFISSISVKQVYVDQDEIVTAEEAAESILSDQTNDIGFSAVKVENYKEKFDLEPEYYWTDSMYYGHQRTIYSGVQGRKSITARVTYTNGQETAREVLNEKVTYEGEAPIIYLGTAPAPEFVIPVDGVLTSGYGERDGGFHKGADFGCDRGDPVWASCEGTVITSEWNSGGYGYMVVIDHGNGIQTRYAHLDELACEVGDYVAQYDVIGYAGDTGESYGVHCHLEVIVYGETVDPFEYLSY